MSWFILIYFLVVVQLYIIYEYDDYNLFMCKGPKPTAYFGPQARLVVVARNKDRQISRFRIAFLCLFTFIYVSNVRTLVNFVSNFYKY